MEAVEKDTADVVKCPDAGYWVGAVLEGGAERGEDGRRGVGRERGIFGIGEEAVEEVEGSGYGGVFLQGICGGSRQVVVGGLTGRLWGGVRGGVNIAGVVDVGGHGVEGGVHLDGAGGWRHHAIHRAAGCGGWLSAWLWFGRWWQGCRLSGC